MKARYFGVPLSHEFFSLVSGEQKEKLYNNKNAHIVSFEEEEYKPIFAIIFEVEKDRLHVTEVGGNFLWRMKWAEIYLTILAKRLDIDTISFCTKREVIEKIGKRLGFNQSKYDEEFEKKVA